MKTSEMGCGICWDSRHVPLPESGIERRVEFKKISEKVQDIPAVTEYLPPRGLEQFQDLDWGRFPLDAGKN